MKNIPRYVKNIPRYVAFFALAALVCLAEVRAQDCLAPESGFVRGKGVIVKHTIEFLLQFGRVDLPQSVLDLTFHGAARRYENIGAYPITPSAEAQAFLDKEFGSPRAAGQDYFVLALKEEGSRPVPFAITREESHEEKQDKDRIWAVPLVDELTAPPTLEPNALLQNYLVNRLRVEHGPQNPLKRSNDVRDIQIDHSKPKFVDWVGVGHPGLRWNLEYVHERPDGSSQVIGVFSNHGEAEAFFRYHHNHGYFGPRNRPVGIWHFDGHADDLSSGQMRKLWPRESFMDYILENLYNFGITNFLGGSVLNGVLFVKKWFFKNTFDGLNYREVMRWAGAHYPGEPVHFDHAPTEGNFISDEEMAAKNLDIVDVDIDIFHEYQDVVEISKHVRYLAKLARNAKMVTFVTSPGWIDQELAVLYTQMLIEMLKDEWTEEKASVYAQAIAKQWDESRTLTLRKVFKQVARWRDYFSGRFFKRMVQWGFQKTGLHMVPKTTGDQSEAIRKHFLKADEELELTKPPQDPTVHFYHGTERLADIQRQLREEFDAEHAAMAMVLRVSPRSQKLRLGDLMREDSPTMDEAAARQLADTLADPPHAFNEFFRQENPLEFAVYKITWHLTSGRHPASLPLLRAVFGLLANNKLPIELRHNLLGFLYVFGKETGLFDSTYKFDYLHNWEILNWRTRLSSIQGIYVDAESQNAFRRALQAHKFSIFDLACILSIDGGGTVTARRKDGSLDVFGYPTGKIDSTEAYAYQMIHGKFEVADIVQAARARRLRAQFEHIVPTPPTRPIAVRPRHGRTPTESKGKIVPLTVSEAHAITPLYASVQDFWKDELHWSTLHPGAKLFYVARHVESASNALRYTQHPFTFSPPTPRGDAQGACMAEFLQPVDFDGGYVSSDLERASKTLWYLAERQGHLSRIKLDERLREAPGWPAGGIPLDQTMSIFPDLHDRFHHDIERFAMPGQPTFEETQRQVQSLLDELIQSGGSRFALSTHGFTKLFLLMKIFNIPLKKFFAVEKETGVPDYAAVTVLAYYPEAKKWELLVWADNSYLPKNLQGEAPATWLNKARNVAWYYREAIPRVFHRMAGQDSKMADYFPTFRGAFVRPSVSQIDAVLRPLCMAETAS